MRRNGSSSPKTRLVLRDYGGDRVEILEIPVGNVNNRSGEHCNGVRTPSLKDRYPWLFGVDPSSLRPIELVFRQIIEHEEGKQRNGNGGNGVERGE